MLIQGRRVSYRSFDGVLRAAENTRKRGKVRHLEQHAGLPLSHVDAWGSAWRQCRRFL